MKRCSNCRAEKPLDDFGRCKATKDGLAYFCFVCNRAKSKEIKDALRARMEASPPLSPDRTKRCPRCQTIKSAIEFTPSKTPKDGMATYCKPCFANYQMDKYQTDPQKFRDRQNNRRASNPESARVRDKAARERDPEIRRARMRAYFQDPDGKWRAYFREWARAHAGESAQRREIQRSKDPEGWRERQQARYRKDIARSRALARMQACKRRAWIRKNGFERVDLNAIIARDGLTCHICKKPVERDKVSPDHLIPISQGGPHMAWNIGVSHKLCNIRRGVGRRIPGQPRLDL